MSEKPWTKYFQTSIRINKKKKLLNNSEYIRIVYKLHFCDPHPKVTALFSTIYLFIFSTYSFWIVGNWCLSQAANVWEAGCSCSPVQHTPLTDGRQLYSHTHTLTPSLNFSHSLHKTLMFLWCDRKSENPVKRSHMQHFHSKKLPSWASNSVPSYCRATVNELYFMSHIAFYSIKSHDSNINPTANLKSAIKSEITFLLTAHIFFN